MAALAGKVASQGVSTVANNPAILCLLSGTSQAATHSGKHRGLHHHLETTTEGSRRGIHQRLVTFLVVWEMNQSCTVWPRVDRLWFRSCPLRNMSPTAVFGSVWLMWGRQILVGQH
ncbi:unnamed protein product [Discosporangium mesarthrocarpum]